MITNKSMIDYNLQVFHTLKDYGCDIHLFKNTQVNCRFKIRRLFVDLNRLAETLNAYLSLHIGTPDSEFSWYKLVCRHSDHLNARLSPQEDLSNPGLLHG